ncbi:hypothetical protein Tco_0453872 [Tanacetum coccineum]
METKVALTKDEEAVDVDVHLYKSMIGSLMYLTASRPDIMFAVCACSHFQVTPKTLHLNVVKRIFNDYGGSNLDRKSTTGGCQFLGQRFISWQCKKQTIVATSTTEAEYVAAANCCGQSIVGSNINYWTMVFNFMNTKSTLIMKAQSALLKRTPCVYSKTKHIEIRHHFIRDCYEKKLISVEKIHTDLNVADLFDQPFDGPRFNYLVVSKPPVQSPPPITAPIPASTPTPIPETDPEPMEHTFEEPSPAHQHFSPPQEHAQGQMTVDDLLQLVPQLMTRVDSLEKDLKQTKLTMGSAIVKLVKKVKKLEGILKRRNVVLSDSEEEEPEAQGRKSQDDPLVSLVQGLVTPSKTTVNASGEEQVEDISPTTLEAAKTLSRVASQKPKSIDKGRRYKRRKETKGKKVVTSLDFQEEVSTGYAEGVNTGSIKVSTVSGKVSTVSGQVSTDSIKKSIPSPDKGQREGKAPMIIEEAPKKTKEQILQEEASLAEAIRLDTLEKEEEAKQVHLDSLLAQRIAEEEELNEQQKQRRAQVQFEAQHYTDEDWDLIRAKIEANAELSKSVLGSGLQGEDFAKKMVKLGTWKLSQLKNLSFEEVKEEFDKLVKQVESFAPINFEATKDIYQEDWKRRKQIARKGLHSDKTDEDESEDSKDDDPISGTNIHINPVPVAIKPPSIATYKIIKQGEKGVYQIVREDGTDIVYINFRAMLKDLTRDDLTKLYRIVMKRYGMNGPKDELEKILWEYLKNMFEEPLSTYPVWSSLDIYMLIERKYPLIAEVYKDMLDKKLHRGKPVEDCYKLLKWMEKQAGIRKHKDWLVQEQTALGKDFSNPLMADNLPKIVWLSTHHIWTDNGPDMHMPYPEGYIRRMSGAMYDPPFILFAEDIKVDTRYSINSLGPRVAFKYADAYEFFVIPNRVFDYLKFVHSIDSFIRLVLFVRVRCVIWDEAFRPAIALHIVAFVTLFCRI